jgi:hypothetical protein
MTLRYAVGIKIGNRADQMTVEAEDALIAALKVKTAHPEAAITYVRKQKAVMYLANPGSMGYTWIKEIAHVDPLQVLLPL